MNKKAFSLIELILVMTILTIVSGAFYSLFLTTSYSVDMNTDRQKAILYAKEGMEIVKNLKYDDFFTLNDGNYSLTNIGSAYSLEASGSEVIDNEFTRTVRISPVYRNEANQISELGETEDKLTKKITVQIQWPGPYLTTKSISLENYFTDWEGTSWIQTTQTQFNTGSADTTSIIASDDLIIPDNGKVELELITNPSTYFATANVFERAKKVFYQNNIVFVGVAKTNGGLCAVDVTDTENLITMDCIDVEGKANDLIVDNDYAYVAVDHNTKGLSVVDVSDPSNMNRLYNLNVFDSVVGIDKQGNHLYLALDESYLPMVIVNVNNIYFPFITGLVFGFSEGTSVSVSGNYAYLTTENNYLKIYNISNPVFPVWKSSTNLGATGTANVYKSGYLYISTNSTSQGLKVLDVSNPASPSIVGTYNLNYSASDLDITEDYLYIAVDNNQGGAAIYDISNPLSLSAVNTIDIQGQGSGVDATDGFIYFATDTSSQGVAIVTRATNDLSSEGTFTSKIFDAGSESINYTSISWLSSIQPGTEIKIQIRSADSEANISGATFVGPDGTSSSYYTTNPSPVTLDAARSGQRYIQWKAYFTGDSHATPSLEDVTIKYE